MATPHYLPHHPPAATGLASALFCLGGVSHYDRWLRKKSIRAVEQLHGPILRINSREGLVFMRMDNGKEMSLPPDLNAYEPAEEGEYGLKSSGEVISNPDLIAAWSFYPDAG